MVLLHQRHNTIRQMAIQDNTDTESVFLYYQMTLQVLDAFYKILHMLSIVLEPEFAGKRTCQNRSDQAQTDTHMSMGL